MPSSLTTLLPPALGFSPHPPVSVYGTGTYGTIAAFLGSQLTYFATFLSLPITALLYETDLPISQLLCLDRSFHSRLTLSFCVPTVLSICSTGISTCYPSPTTIVLSLGPDLPWADEPSPGNLGLSTCMFLACISLLIPAFSLLHRPRLLTVPLQPMHYAPLPLAYANPKLRWCVLAPLHLRRTITRPVSYYALFE